MNKLLSLLMCFVFLQAETFALRGGPGGRNGVELINGQYSGTLTETTGGGSLGMFLLTAVDNGASIGQVVFFTSSTVNVDTYSGTITGLTDPNTGNFSGIFGATGSTGLAGTSNVSGQLTCTAKKAVTNANTQTISGTGAARNSQVIIAGSSILVTIGALTLYSVSGWRTSISSTGNPFPTSF
jgi:hypothetical protein